MKRGVLLGAWGHWPEVLRELDAAGGGFEIAGTAAVREEDGDAPPARIAGAFECASGAMGADDPAALLASVRPDFAVVSARPGRIAGLVALAAGAGCHVISEKPLATSFGELDALERDVAAAGVQVCPMLPNRARPALAAAVAAIRAGAIGRPLLLSARKTYKWGRREPWYGDRAAYGGTIPWIGIHALDFIDAATGGDPVEQIAAFHANLAHPEMPGCEDACALSMRLASGALATATLDFLRPDSPVPHGDDFLRVSGAHGEIAAWLDRDRAEILAPGATPQELPLPSPAPFFTPWLRALPPRGCRTAPDETSRRAFRLTREALLARDAADRAALFEKRDAVDLKAEAGANGAHALVGLALD
ncbi:MAG: Gfo/Idh/MocA family oxidoreductase [Kiritimatiellae bacterium]|nr:Gfo/Idh/MocA family oxidoreductase [Kiritimatiellia bacterium]